MLTQDMLNEFEPFTVINSGIVADSRLHHSPVRWVAVRGGVGDWAIYYHHADKSVEFVRNSGDKCIFPDVIRELIPCTDEAFKKYRY